METFKIEVKETLSRVIEIEANSMDEAHSIVREMYRKEEIIIDSECHIDTEFIEIEK